MMERSKGFCLASSEGMGKALQAALGEEGVTRVREVKRLGVDHWWGKSRSKTGPVLTLRLLSGKRRAKRLIRLKKVDGGDGGPGLHGRCDAPLHLRNGVGRGSGTRAECPMGAVGGRGRTDAHRHAKGSTRHAAGGRS